MLSKLRISAHKLAKECGRYINIPKQERICTARNAGEVEDEEHFVCLVCCFTSQVNSYGHGGRSVHLPTLFPGQA